MDKSHVEHTIGLVEDQDLDLVQTHMILTHQVEKTARRGHKNVGPFSQRADLPTHRYSSQNDAASEGQIASVRAEAGFDLQCKLPGGS